MDITLNYKNCLSETVGEENGISNSDIDRNSHKLKEASTIIKNQRKQGNLRFLDIPYDDEVINSINRAAERFSNDWENIVILGIGGSALGNIMLFKSVCHPNHNLLSTEKRNGTPRFFAADNVDPEYISSILDVIDIEKTLFNVISKSGSTAETNATFLISYDMLRKKLGKRCNENIVAITDKNKGTLKEICDKENIYTLPFPEGIEGRFSILSPVGLFSSKMLGINIEEIMAGARKMDEICSTGDFEDNPAYINALIHWFLDTKKDKKISVLMPYSNSLTSFADWYRQLWAESLGKSQDRNNIIINCGQTPVSALGTTDQHSQLQLYNEGPNDKIITFLAVENFDNDITIPNSFPAEADVNYLGGQNISKLLNNERIATAFSLSKNNRPNLTITIPQISPYTIGQLIYMYELQTAVAGELYNVNAFNQPGVEESKLFTYGLMGKSGYEDKANEIMESG